MKVVEFIAGLVALIVTVAGMLVAILGFAAVASLFVIVLYAIAKGFASLLGTSF